MVCTAVSSVQSPERDQGRNDGTMGEPLPPTWKEFDSRKTGSLGLIPGTVEIQKLTGNNKESKETKQN